MKTKRQCSTGKWFTSYYSIVPRALLGIWTLHTLPITMGVHIYYSCLSVAEECVLPERCTTPVWEEQDEPAARSFDSGTYEHPASPPLSPPHPSSEHTITTSLSTMTSLSDYSSASSSQDSSSELSSPTGVSSLYF